MSDQASDAILTALCVDDCRLLVPNGRHATGCPHFTPSLGKAWCRTCRSMRQISEASDESTYRGAHEVGYWVERLACGHENEYERGIIGASPGGDSIREALTQQVLQRRQEGWDHA